MIGAQCSGQAIECGARNGGTPIACDSGVNPSFFHSVHATRCRCRASCVWISCGRHKSASLAVRQWRLHSAVRGAELPGHVRPRLLQSVRLDQLGWQARVPGSYAVVVLLVGVLIWRLVLSAGVQNQARGRSAARIALGHAGQQVCLPATGAAEAQGGAGRILTQNLPCPETPNERSTFTVDFLASCQRSGAVPCVARMDAVIST